MELRMPTDSREALPFCEKLCRTPIPIPMPLLGQLETKVDFLRETYSGVMSCDKISLESIQTKKELDSL
jgi:hypothetical protein